MKKILVSGLLVLCSSSAMAQQCVDIYQARKALNTYLSPLVGKIPSQDFPWLEQDRDANPLSDFDVKKALSTLKWNSKKLVYETSSVVGGYCAPAAEAWGWYAVDCGANVAAQEACED